MKLRILHIPHAYSPVFGGAEILCQKISEKLVKYGHQVRVLTANVGSVDGYYQFGIPPVALNEEMINGVEVKRLSYSGILYAIGTRLVSKLPWWSLRNRCTGYLMLWIRHLFEQKINNEIQKFKPDVVMTMPHLVVNVQCVLRAHERKQFPLVMVPLLHEEDPHRSVQPMASALERADAIIANTDYEAAQLLKSYRVPAEKIFTCWAGVDLPSMVESGKRAPRILFLGRKIFSKGIPDLLAAMELVWQEQPVAELILAGARGPTTSDIEELIAKLPEHRRKRVKSLDNISESEKSNLLSTCACLILPSRIESFGIVLLEAWAHYTPIITLNLPVFRNLVTDGIDGLLVNPDDIPSMANAVLFILKHSELARAMGKSGRKKVEQYFTWDKVASRYIEAYKYAVSDGVKIKNIDLTTQEKLTIHIEK